MNSDLQMIAFGAYAAGTGGLLAINPTLVLKMLKPITSRVEAFAGLQPMVEGPGLAAAGVLASAIGIYYLMAVQSGDEKYKRSTILGRLIFGINCLAVCKFSQHGSGMLALLGVGDLLAALAMHLTIGGAGGKGKKL